MFKERLREILKNYGNWCAALEGAHPEPNNSIGPDEALSEILKLVKEIVPPEFIPSGGIENDEAGGFNDCRQTILTNLGGDK